MVLVAISMVFLLGIAALAVDLAALRSDIRTDQLASDAAATAGVASINPFTSTGAVEACETAWAYVLLNLEDEGSTLSPPDCNTSFSGSCDPAASRLATGTAGPYTVEITHPVPDAHALMGSQALNVPIDGVSCQRLGVAIERSRDHTFARVIGFTSDTTKVNTVARSSTAPGQGEIVPLLLLEPLACDALYTSGQGRVTVSYHDPTDTPGIIVVDSAASTCGPSTPYSIDNQAGNQGWIRAIPVPGENIPSAILSYALSGISPSVPAASYDPSDLINAITEPTSDPLEPAASFFRLFPQPTPTSERITRAPIDWRYNCKSGYPDYPLDLGNPGLGGIPIQDCPFATATHIDSHISAYDSGVVPTYQVWTTEGHPCSVGSNNITVSGNWHIDCPVLDINGGTVSISGNVVFDGGIDLNSDSTLWINNGATSDHFVYLRSGIILKRAQSSLTFGRTFVYLADGYVDLRAGTGLVNWSSPDGGNFEDLALWSEGRYPHEIGGQALNSLVGTFFTPFAEPFSLTGQSAQFQLDAQFITRRLEVKGQGEVRMTPNPEKSTPIPARAVQLIR